MQPPFPNSTAPRPRRWGRIFAFALIAVLLLAAAAFFGFSFWLNAYLHGDAFRALVSQKTSAFLHAEGEYMPFHWNGLSVYSDGYRARSLFGALQADQLRAEFNPHGVFHRAWQINDLEIQRLQLTFGRVTAATNVASPSPPPASSESFAEPRRRSSWIPDRLELQRTRIQETDLNWTPTGHTGSLRQVRVTIEPEGRAWLLTGHGGQLQQTGWPALTVDHLKLRYQSPTLFVNDSLFKLSDSENVNLSGQVVFGENPTADLRAKFAGVVITPFLPEDWRAKLHGQATGEARLTGPDALTVTGQLHLVSGQLEALPVLDRIALFTQTAQFRRLTLQKATADFVWTKPKLTVSHLVLESEGLLRVEGDFVVVARQLEGVFQVGVTPTSLRWLPGSQSRVFTVERNGYVWTPVRVAGPLHNVKEDLSQRLIAAAGAEVIDDVKGTVEKGARGVLELLKPLLQ
jgi:hypothetical protein